MAKLPPRQERFVIEYIKNPNATEAAKKAGYSSDTARSQGQRLLTNVDIMGEIDKKREKYAEKVGITTEWVINELKYQYESAKLWSSAVAIVPLRIGGGTRLKIYEAMAAQIPVVSTTIGAEGLSVNPRSEE